jgi:hypothetical protein
MAKHRYPSEESSWRECCILWQLHWPISSSSTAFKVNSLPEIAYRFGLVSEILSFKDDQFVKLLEGFQVFFLTITVKVRDTALPVL